MSRTLSTATCSRKHFRILGASLAVALTAGCGSSGSGDDNSAPTGGATYVYHTGGRGTGGAGGVIYATYTGTRIVITVGGRTGTGLPQGGTTGAPTGGAVSTSTCITGTLNCSCYSSGACASGFICNTSKMICVRDTSVGGTTAAGGSQATGGASGGGSTAVGGSSVTTGGATAAGGSQATGGTPGGGTVATGGSPTTGGAPSGGTTGTGTGVAHNCTDLTSCCTRLTDTTNQSLCFTVVASATSAAVCDTMWRQFGC